MLGCALYFTYRQITLHFFHEETMSIYDYSLPTADGNSKSMQDFQGKVLLIVNTATGCGFTPHYEPLEKMYEAYHDQGFEVIDVPCNQFGGQTPEGDSEIHEFCTLKYNTQFPQYKKSDVNGENALPLFSCRPFPFSHLPTILFLGTVTALSMPS